MSPAANNRGYSVELDCGRIGSSSSNRNIHTHRIHSLQITACQIGKECGKERGSEEGAKMVPFRRFSCLIIAAQSRMSPSISLVNYALYSTIVNTLVRYRMDPCDHNANYNSPSLDQSIPEVNIVLRRLGLTRLWPHVPYSLRSMLFWARASAGGSHDFQP